MEIKPSINPTWSTSVILGSSQGLEPIFEPSYIRGKYLYDFSLDKSERRMGKIQDVLKDL